MDIQFTLFLLYLDSIAVDVLFIYSNFCGVWGWEGGEEWGLGDGRMCDGVYISKKRKDRIV